MVEKPYYWVITIQAIPRPGDDGGTRMRTYYGRLDDVSKYVDKYEIFTVTFSVACKELGVAPDRVAVVFWSLEISEFEE
jgi:hypothetical protein